MGEREKDRVTEGSAVDGEGRVEVALRYPREPGGQNEGNRTNQEVQGRIGAEKQDERYGLDVLSWRGQQDTKGKMSRSRLEMKV